jgi:thiol-disulfide isomerase/thioredoxin
LALLSLGVLVGFESAVGAETPPAAAVLVEATARATAENKAVFVHFSASWCSWCRRLEAFMHEETIAPIFQKYFVDVRLVVREREPNLALNHPGGMDVLTRLGGAERGIPFTAVLAADGTMVANSLIPVADPAAKDGVENLGYPGEPETIGPFLDMLQRGAPTMTADERRILEGWLVAHQPQ